MVAVAQERIKTHVQSPERCNRVSFDTRYLDQSADRVELAARAGI